jgi:signal transduction histidine kinase
MSDYEKELIYLIAIIAFLMPLIILGVLIWFIHLYQTKKYQNEVVKRDALLREQSLIIEKNNVVNIERQRIAEEMHDDMGSGLTRIKYLCEKLIDKHFDSEKIEDIRKIKKYSSELVGNLSEIIWALNSRLDNTCDLIAYIRRHLSEYLEEMGMDFEIEIQGKLVEHQISGEKRRNVFLVVNELIHNAVKYSSANKIWISFYVQDKLRIRIFEENGLGFDPQSKVNYGEGVNNIYKRVEAINGKISFEKSTDGMTIILDVPL